MSLNRKIGVIVNISLTELTAHPIFCLQLSHQLTRFGAVTLFVPRNGTGIEVKGLQQKLGFPVNFNIVVVQDRLFGVRSLRYFFYFSVLKLWLQRRTLLWAFEPYSIQFASFLRIPSVMEIHASLPPPRFIRVCRKIQKSPRFRLFIANSEAHCRLLISKGFHKEKLVAAHNAISEQLLNQRPLMPDKAEFWRNLGVEGEFVITYAGSLYKGRGVEAMLEVAPEYPHCAFVVLGGPEAERCKLNLLKKSSNVYLLGAIAHLDVPAYLSASDVLLALYNEDCEDIGGNRTITTASPMKLFEYMASGVPLISSAIGAIPEIVESGQSGILINPLDLNALKKAINELYESKSMSSHISDHALKRVRQFTWTGRLNKIFSKLNS